MRKLSYKSILVVPLLVLISIYYSSSYSNAASGEQKRVEKHEWTFAGIFGHYDNAQLQRGFQVYKEVCSS
ncbi:MAG: cytochrome c1, partial [Hyphomicrobiales bacterium]|nr:cytochrome c1 [Hyphomicrobiales bacterium]